MYAAVCTAEFVALCFSTDGKTLFAYGLTQMLPTAGTEPGLANCGLPPNFNPAVPNPANADGVLTAWRWNAEKVRTDNQTSVYLDHTCGV